MNIEQIRRDTPGCANIIHLNNAGAALMPSCVADTIKDYISKEEINGGYETADAEADELNLFYTNAAELLQCKPSNIAFTTSATESYNRALSSVPLKPGDTILISGNDYPSNYIAFISLAKRMGIKPVRINNTSTGEADLEDLENKIRQHAPKLVSITHIPTSSGLVQPVEAIGAITSKYDTLYLLDACQSLGQLELNALTSKADFISGTFRKFLRGPRGAGLLYVSDKALAAGNEPLFPDLRGADWTSENSYKPRSDAKRFEDWETAYALMIGSKEALKYLLNIGIKNIESRNNYLNGLLREKLGAIKKIALQDKGKKQCSIITFSMPDATEKMIKQYFRSKGINIYTTSKSAAVLDFTEKGIEWAVRISPHYYNTEEELNLFVEALKEL